MALTFRAIFYARTITIQSTARYGPLYGFVGFSRFCAGDPPPVQNEKQTETYFLPAGDLFNPLIADIKMPRFFVSYRQYRYQDKAITIGAVGVGQVFGLYRSVDRDSGPGWQANSEGGLQAQFNLDASSEDLINADYFVGVPLSYRKGAMS
jgi:hypothetical protein